MWPFSVAPLAAPHRPLRYKRITVRCGWRRTLSRVGFWFRPARGLERPLDPLGHSGGSRASSLNSPSSPWHAQESLGYAKLAVKPSSLNIPPPSLNAMSLGLGNPSTPPAPTPLLFGGGAAITFKLLTKKAGGKQTVKELQVGGQAPTTFFAHAFLRGRSLRLSLGMQRT